VWSSASTPPYMFMAACIIKHRNFTFCDQDHSCSQKQKKKYISSQQTHSLFNVVSRTFRDLSVPPSLSGLVSLHKMTPGCQAFVEKSCHYASNQEIPCHYGNQMFIILFKNGHCAQYWDTWYRYPPQKPFSKKNYLILSSHLCLGLPNPLPFK